MVSQPSPMLSAALLFAARGWPVFPCSPRDKTPLLPRDVDAEGKPIPKSGGVTKASTDPDQIAAWWARWPKALVAIATGHPTLDAGGARLFVVDFDPRVDADTGEVYELARLKEDTEAQIGCALPRSLTARTPSDGVHLYLLQDDGPAITNRGNLPEHVDVRGLGGYVIAPPSVMGPNAIKGQGGLGYRWHREGDVAAAPAELLAALRARGSGKADRASAGSGRTGGEGVAGGGAASGHTGGEVDADEAVRRYGLAALDAECNRIRTAPSGKRNAQLNASAFAVAALVAAGALSSGLARAMVEDAARANPGQDDAAQLDATIASGWTAGLGNPRDLSDVRDRQQRRQERGPPSRAGNPRTPGPTGDGRPSSRTGASGGSDDCRGSGGRSRQELARACALLPLTDLGNAERFVERHGERFLYVPEWGWMAWDGKRWNRDLAESMVALTVYDTVRGILDEAKLVQESGMPEPPLELWDEEQRRAHARAMRDRLDKVVRRKRDEIVLLSDTIRAWARTSEGAGHLKCIAGLAQPKLTARVADFDADPMRLNLDNGTLVFRRGRDGAGATAELRPFDRADRITKLAPVVYDPAASCPRWDAFLSRVQPDAGMRRFLDQWGGYGLTGDISEQKMALFYGEGANGKSTWTDTVAFILGDYARQCGIETFIDQGRQRKGGDATPDLAALAGARMVRTSEPERGSKFSDGLIKSITGGEPMMVRELNHGFFEMQVTYKVTCSANVKPQIGSDHGIKRRVRLIPWEVIIPEAERDPKLTEKLRAEASGILNRLVAGAIDWMTHGLVEPEAVIEATQEYQAENDPLGAFIALCLRRESGERAQSSRLYELFKGWAKWAGQEGANGRPWSQKTFTAQMHLKGFKSKQSNTIQWLDVRMLFEPTDFVDAAGQVVIKPLPDVPPATPAPPAWDEDGMPP